MTNPLIGWGAVQEFPMTDAPVDTGVMFGGTTSTSKPKDVVPPEIAALRTPFADKIKELMGTSGGLSGIPAYQSNAAHESSLVAPMGANEQSLLDQLMQNQTSGPSAEARALLQKTLRGDFLPGQSGSNPFLDAAISSAQRPTLEALTQTLTRDLPGRFTANGQMIQPHGSSAFDRAAALATGGAANALGDIATNISYQGYNDERQRQQAAIPLSQQEVQTTIDTLNAQALPRLIQDMGIQRGLAEYQTRLDSLLKVLATLTGSPLTATADKTKSTTSPNIFGSLFPGGVASTIV